ncbi:hypothetical protein EYV94_04720 [Puteibacter caeruleilacunae]|nr:hypothetical protein EYV94_04720 [Puteibacter caeruleilacunae]
MMGFESWNLKYLLFVLLIFLCNQTFSQSSNFTGKVIDYESKNAIAGATIVDADNSLNGTISDFDGYFEIEIKRGKRNIEIGFVGYYQIKLLNIPEEDRGVDLGAIRLAANHLLDNMVVGGTWQDITDEQKEQDKQLRKDYLKNYRFKILGKELKPSFKRKCMVFDFDNR